MNKYRIGDRVFAKIKGFCHWPAIIDAIDIKSKICKYNVTFYGTKEVGLALKEIDICPFLENKSKYGSLKAKNFLKAMKEAEKSLNNSCNSSKSHANLSDSTSIAQIAQTPLKDFPDASSTPLKTEYENCNQSNKIINNQQNSTQTNTKILCKEVAVNTTIELDRDLQLHAITEKCISLEVALMELKTKTNSDFHTEILKQQLDKLKKENLNLLGVIETLEIDKKILEEKINKLPQHHKCLNCYPPLKKCLMASASWQVASTSHSFKASSSKLNTFEIPCKNRFNELASDRTDDKENSQGSQIAVNNKFSNGANRKNNFKPKPQTKVVRTNSESNYSSKLIILADSHGKQLGRIIEQKTSTDVCSFIRSGAHFNGVTEEVKQHTKTLTNKDYLLIIAGTNNIEDSSSERLSDDISNLIKSSQHMNLILGTVPMRYDRADLDLKISAINSKIETIAVNYPNLKLLPLHHLPRHVYTVHGLHFNKKGKVRIAEMVSRLMQTEGLHQKQAVDAKKAPSSVHQPCTGGGVMVVEEEMSKVIERHVSDPTVGLAHTVSRDFHMSAGVAVMFRRKFGRPHMSDLIFQNLACQQVTKGPSVYSLLTKKVYYGKPTNEEYNTAFQQLKLDFQNRGLKVLICSAMGCVRDLIRPQHFVDNIIEFQKATGAKVYIVSYNQEARRKLWHGMSHDEFVKTLRQLIADRLESSSLEGNRVEDQSATPDISTTQASGPNNEFLFPAVVSECSQTVSVCSGENGQSSIESVEVDCKVKSPQGEGNTEQDTTVPCKSLNDVFLQVSNPAVMS